MTNSTTTPEHMPSLYRRYRSRKVQQLLNGRSQARNSVPESQICISNLPLLSCTQVWQGRMNLPHSFYYCCQGGCVCSCYLVCVSAQRASQKLPVREAVDRKRTRNASGLCDCDALTEQEKCLHISTVAYGRPPVVEPAQHILRWSALAQVFTFFHSWVIVMFSKWL